MMLEILIKFYALYEKAYTWEPVGFHQETESYSIDHLHGYYATRELAKEVEAKIRKEKEERKIVPYGTWKFDIHEHIVEKLNLVEEAPGTFSYGGRVIRTKPIW